MNAQLSPAVQRPLPGHGFRVTIRELSGRSHSLLLAQHGVVECNGRKPGSGRAPARDVVEQAITPYYGGRTSWVLQEFLCSWSRCSRGDA